jgi:ABC-2 type transport system ATP-binding protein
MTTHATTTSERAASAGRGEPAIDLRRVDKRYGGKVHALRDAALRVEHGQIFGLLGPNGAGKSTLVKILMTVVKPTACDGRMLGRPVGDKSALRRVGYLPEHHKFPDYLTGRQVLDFYAALAGVPRVERRKRENELLDLVGLSAWADKRVRSYSKGMRQRVGIAQALMNDPDLVLLDEPTDGVDPVGRRDIRNVLSAMKDRGKTVLLNSHLLSELEMVCDRVAIMVKGRLWAQGTLDELTAADQRYELEVAGEGEAGPRLIEAELAKVTQPGPKGLALITGEAVSVQGSTIRVETTDAGKVQPIIDALRRAGLVIRTVRGFRPSLEDLFIRAVTDPTTGKALAPGAEGPGEGTQAGRAAR